MTPSDEIVLEDVTVQFPERTVLDRLSLTCAAGQRTAIVGTSGCGKSTLLRTLIGLILPDEGRIVIRGQDMSDGQWQAIRHQIGYVIQAGGLFPHLTALQNVTLLAETLGWSRSRQVARAGELAELVQLEEPLLQRRPEHLSGGQQQRVALMRALMLDPPLLLLDEPLGALDPMIRSDLQRDLARIFESLKKTIVLVTHDLTEAAFLCERIAVLDGGRCVQVDSLEGLSRDPASDFVAHFVGAQRASAEVWHEQGPREAER